MNTLLFIEFNKPGSIYSGVIHREKRLAQNLKVDFLIDGAHRTIVEAKGIITEDPTAYFPAMSVERAVSQLRVFYKLLCQGDTVHYYIVLMNPEIQKLKLNITIPDFCRSFRKCVKKGMRLFVYRINGTTNGFHLNRDHLTEQSFYKETLALRIPKKISHPTIM